jgi:methionine synthase I (cobalamin-dependent)
MSFDRATGDIFAYLRSELSRRIMIIDGAMGTMIQVLVASRGGVSGSQRR